VCGPGHQKRAHDHGWLMAGHLVDPPVTGERQIPVSKSQRDLNDRGQDALPARPVNRGGGCHGNWVIRRTWRVLAAPVRAANQVSIEDQWDDLALTLQQVVGAVES